MIALFLTFVIATYLLGPDLVSRWVVGFVCPRKNIVQSKGEELTRAVVWAIIPFCLAVWWASAWGTLARCAGWVEWKLFFSSAYSEAIFQRDPEAAFHAIKAVFWWNVAALWRMYLMVFCFWTFVAIAISKFGSWRHRLKQNRYLRWVAHALTFFIVPRVSEWHIFLSSMLAENKDIRIHADILTKGDVLYKGYVEGKMLEPDGRLGSVLLADPYRFRREEYVAEKKKSLETPGSQKPDKEEFWVKIPSKTFILMASEISTINVKHSSESALNTDKGIVEALRRVLSQYEGSGANNLLS